jgi:hypothetical protein
MNKLYQYAITIILLCNIGITKAQNSDDHLEPVHGFFDSYNFSFEYYSNVRKVLLNGLSDRPDVRYLILPSFSPESVLDIELDRDNYKCFLIYHICEQKICYNKQWETVKVKKYKTEMDIKSAKLLISLFSMAIAQVRFPPPVEKGGMVAIRHDGENYYFSVKEVGYGMKSGKVWSPEPGTKMNKLVTIGNKLIELAKSDTEIVIFSDELQKEIEELIEELK